MAAIEFNEGIAAERAWQWEKDLESDLFNDWFHPSPPPFEPTWLERIRLTFRRFFCRLTSAYNAYSKEG